MADPTPAPSPPAGSPSGQADKTTGPSHKGRGIVALMIIMAVALLVPSFALGAIGKQEMASVAILPIIVGLFSAMMAGPRVALIAAPVLALLNALATLSAHVAWAALLVMAIAAFAMGITSRFGFNTALTLAPITIGFTLGGPAHLSDSAGTNALLVGAVTLGAVLWGTLFGWQLHTRMPKQPPAEDTWGRATIFALTLAVLTGIAAFITVHWDWGHTGAWFILTVVLILRPYVQDALSRGVQRALGTVIGFAIVIVIYLAIPWTPVLYLFGAAFMVAAMLVQMDPTKPYWVFTALLTPAIVLCEGAATSVVTTDVHRLGATLVGVALSLVAEALLYPGYRAGAKRRGLDHF